MGRDSQAEIQLNVVVPSWLDGMRSRGVQLPVVAEMIEQVRVPSIAKWRWSTLHTAVDPLAGVLPTLSTHFDANFTITRCKSALHSTAISICAVVYDVGLRYSALGSWL